MCAKLARQAEKAGQLLYRSFAASAMLGRHTVQYSSQAGRWATADPISRIGLACLPPCMVMTCSASEPPVSVIGGN